MGSLKEQVDYKERTQGRRLRTREEGLRYVGILAGTVVYAIGINLFLRPLHLYSGGIMGFSQVFTTLLKDVFGIYTGSIDLSGIIYYILNLPGLIMALYLMPKRFFVKTIFTITSMTVVLTFIPIPALPILEETIANCIVSGILAGIGIGFVLRMGACDGGMDLIGMILIQRKGNYSIGGINMAANLLLYGICLLLFDIPTVIYSLLYSVAFSMMCDRMHVQNINIQVLIITKIDDIEPLEVELMSRMRHGLTRWKAAGGYTGAEETVLMTVISKYEINQLKTIVHEYDPHAFVLMDEGVGVDGNYLKKLV